MKAELKERVRVALESIDPDPLVDFVCELIEEAGHNTTGHNTIRVEMLLAKLERAAS